MRKVIDRRGFTLLEVMIAMVVTAIGLLGIAGMIVTAIRGNTYSARLMEATNLAQDKVEELRGTPYVNLYGSCGGFGAWNVDPCTDPPANMPDSNPAVDNGSNGDEVASDGIWTYQYTSPPAATALDNNMEVVWGVQRNYPQVGLILGFSNASWTSAGGKVHNIRLETILANL